MPMFSYNFQLLGTLSPDSYQGTAREPPDLLAEPPPHWWLSKLIDNAVPVIQAVRWNIKHNPSL